MIITLRHATPEDAEFLFRLRTDPETVEQSFGPPPKSMEDQRLWIESQARIFIAEHRDVAIGMGQLPGGNKVGVTIAPEARGHGLAIHVIEALEMYALNIWNERRFVAEIKPENHRSIRAFQSAGYRLHHLVFEKHLT